MVTRRRLIVTASSGSTTYGGAPPTITASYSGFVNGDDATDLTTAADMLDDGHVVEPGGPYADLVHRRRRLQLRDHVPERLGDGRPQLR